MDDRGWIKLYRKTLLNGILLDPPAWVLFTYLLLSCNRKGEFIVSRFTTAQALKMKPETFRHVLERLVSRWGVIGLKPTNKFTVVQIVNWAKYQLVDDVKTTKRPPKDQQKTTYTRIENKNENTHKTIAQNARCPLESSGNHQDLKTRYPNGHKECIEFIDSIAQSKGHKFVNYPKQIRFVHQCLRSGFGFDAMDRAINKIEKDRFYQEKGWDFANVATTLDKNG